MTILEVRGLTRRFGGLFAVSGLSFSVEAGEIRDAPARPTKNEATARARVR